ncbi:MAG: hypothetical protein BGO62_05345 [Thiobacillus sp. 65-1402]|nr:MAG: hypothetical protein BGO62_05345 [Thiobacillus sp. 65-1402]
MKTKCFFLIGAIALVSSGAALAALTTEELTRLKASGLGEDVIRFMVESDYANVDRVVRLKEAGFADETVSSVIRNDLKAGGQAKLPAPQPEQPRQAQPAAEPAAEAAVIMQTSAKVRIEQYWVYGEPVVQNSQDIQNATISLLQGRRLKIEWDTSKGVSTPGNFFRGKPFASPFYWDLDKSDGLYSVNPKDNSFILKTGYSHRGRPTADKSHYWMVHLTPQSPDLAKKIRESLAE